MSSRVPKALLATLLGAVVWAAPLRADEAEDQYAVAAGHYAHKRWEFAAEGFQAFLNQYANHAQANQSVFFLAEALVQLGRPDEAVPHFRNYLSREPEGRFAATALFRVGEAAYLAAESDLGKVELERFLNAYPDDALNAYVLPYLGDVALTQNDALLAEKYFRRGLSRFPQGQMQDACRFGLARALEKQDKVEEAERFYMAVAAKTGSSLADDAQFNLGALQYVSGRFEETLTSFEAFESRLEESPWQSTARLGRGWALVKLGRLAEAKTVLESITADAKVGVEARYWLGLTEKAQKDWPSAARTLLEAAAEHPDHELTAALRFHAGESLFHAGRTAEAGEQFDHVIASTRDDNHWVDDAMRGKVQVALQTKDYQTLDRQAAEFATRFPQSEMEPDVQRMLAQSLFERKQHERAIQVLERLIQAGPEAGQALEDRYLLSLSFEGLERHQEALEALTPVVESGAGRLRADAQLTRASLLMKLKRFEEAIAPLEAFLASNPTADDEAACLGNLAICYAEVRQLDKARQRYAELLEKHAGHELVAPTTEQLAQAVYDAGDLAWAETLFTQLADDGQSTGHRLEGLSGLAWSQHKAGRLEKAAATFDRVLKGNPDPPLAAETALARGRILQQLGEPDQALAMYDMVIDRWKDTGQYPEALWAAALLRDSLEQDREAAEQYERLATAYPKFREIDALLYNWAWTLDDMKRPEESGPLFDRLRQEHPTSSYWADATFRLAQRSFEAKDYKRSRQLISELLAAETTGQVRENTLYLQGQVAAAEQQWDQARRAFQTLLDEYPESALRLTAEYGIAEATFRKSEYREAGELFDRLLLQVRKKDQPWMGVVPLRLAQALCHQKRWDEAYQIASTISAEYPDFEEQYEVDYVIGRCLASRAEFELARQAYRKVIQSPQGAKTETAAKAQLMIAESYYHQEDYPQALREYLALEILYAYPVWQATAVFQAAKCHEMLGEWKQAVDEYARLLADYPDTSFTKEATERLRAARQRLAAEPTT